MQLKQYGSQPKHSGGLKRSLQTQLKNSPRERLGNNKNSRIIRLIKTITSPLGLTQNG